MSRVSYYTKDNDLNIQIKDHVALAFIHGKGNNIFRWIGENVERDIFTKIYDWLHDFKFDHNIMESKIEFKDDVSLYMNREKNLLRLTVNGKEYDYGLLDWNTLDYNFVP